MAVNARVPAQYEEAKRRNLLHGMTDAEGAEVFRRVIASPAPNILVLTQDYDRIVAERLVAESRDATPVQSTRRIVDAPIGHARPDLSVAYTPPSTDLEREIAEIWSQLLGISGVGLHDNFFELGGHSLLATLLISRLRESCGVQVPLRAIFDASTVADLSRYVAAAQWAISRPTTPSDSDEREEVDF